MIIHEKNVWYSPLLPFNAVAKLVADHGMSMEEIDKRFKKLREARALGVGALVLASVQETFNPTFIQLNANDPPDGFIFRQLLDNIGHMRILKVEVTDFYDGEEKLNEQLIRTGKLSEPPIFDEYHILLVVLRTENGLDFSNVLDTLTRTKSPFPVITIYPKVNDVGDTVAQTTIIDSSTDEITSKEINVGRMAYLYRKNEVPTVLFTKRTGSVKNVRFEDAKENGPDPEWVVEIEQILGENL